ncbi:MAG: RluA family pseudouridine synthase [Planctomycetes bacterium]|nr:RluA family pseudouridine synthase [Planctomycetota bacterium]
MPRLARQYRDLSVPVTAFTFTVNLPEVGARLDALLRAHYPWKSRQHFQRMIDRGDVTLNGEVRKASVRVRKGDQVAVRIPVPADAPERESAEGLVVLYEDEALVAIDKPSGVTAHPVGRIRHGTLINALHARYRRVGPDADGEDVVPRLAHRLDKDTSGVLLVVKDRRLDAVVTRAFHRREVEKTYLALVRGVPARGEGVVDTPIGPAPDAQTKLEMTVREDGMPSRTRWRVREAFAGFALLEVEPKTGRTHQIRVHLRSIGHPIVADHLYGDVRPLRASTVDPAVPDTEDEILLDRLALHAHRLVLRHPSTGATLRVESPVPADLGRALDGLRRLSARRRSTTVPA